MREALAAEPLRSEVQALRHHLLSLACDADVVLDLHCDDRAILHLYADPAWQAEAGVVAAFPVLKRYCCRKRAAVTRLMKPAACRGIAWPPAFRNGSTAAWLYGGDRGAARSAGCESRAGPRGRRTSVPLLQYRGVLAGACPPVPQQETLMLPFAGERLSPRRRAGSSYR
jgi:hypothetical protein